MWFIVEFVKEILSFLKIIGGVMSAAILFLKRKGLWATDLDFVRIVMIIYKCNEKDNSVTLRPTLLILKLWMIFTPKR